MGGLAAIDVEVVVGEHSAAHRGHADGALANPQLVDDLCHQAMDEAMGTARAVVGIEIGQCLGVVIDQLIVGQIDGHWLLPSWRGGAHLGRLCRTGIEVE